MNLTPFALLLHRDKKMNPICPLSENRGRSNLPPFAEVNLIPFLPLPYAAADSSATLMFAT